MKNLKLKIILLLAGWSATTWVHAHSGDYYNQSGYRHYRYIDRVDKRQLNQQRRIEEGIVSGEITPREWVKLDRQQVRIARLEDYFKRDGRLSAKEKRILRDKLDKAAWRIDRLKHNNRYRPDGYYSYNR